MATINEDYVSYETARLLKEKGFDAESPAMLYKKHDNADGTSEIWTACTHQMACKWLREVHNLHIAIERGPKGYHISIETIPLGVVKYITREIVGTTYIDSYEEAVEAALKYCLKNLI